MAKKSTGPSADLLLLWQNRFSEAKSDYENELQKMDRREQRYRGEPVIYDPNGKALKKKATHVRNVVMENIETEIDSNIPQPKVTALHPEDEDLAKLIEDLIRNELDRLPTERLNDEAERICPIQGGAGFLLDWDNRLGGHDTIGDVALRLQHPKRIIPQSGVYQVEEMDWFFLQTPQTKLSIKRRFGVDLAEAMETETEVKTLNGTSSPDMVTMDTAYYRNKSGGIGRYSWVDGTDIELESLEDYQERRVFTCKKCGAVGDGVKCRECGGISFAENAEDVLTLTDDVTRSDGTVIPALSQKRDEYGQPVFETVGTPTMVQPMDTGAVLLQQPGGYAPVGVMQYSQEPVMEPTQIPYYKPNLYPLVLRKNVSLFGQFLGASDVDAIESQQNTINKLSTKIGKKILGSGSFTTKPKGAKLEITDEDNMVMNVNGPSDLEAIKTFSTQADVSSDLNYQNAVYEESRQELGVTDSLQGRKDATATSKIAKEFSASQAAGRMESKKVMKQAAFADLFELMFKLILAYADEPRAVLSYNEQGQKEYLTFNKWDFLRQDAAGVWYWNDAFLFSCDSSAPLASNREAMWQEARMNLETGAYGDKTAPETLVLFWSVMKELHYPLAAKALDMAQKLVEQKEAAAAQAAAMQQELLRNQAAGQVPGQVQAATQPVATGMEGGAAQ